MKLCFIIRSLNNGGAQRQLIELANNLSQEKFDITVIVFYSGGNLEKYIANEKVKLISLDKKGKWDLLNFWLKLVKLLKNIQPDIIHPYLSTANLLGLSSEFSISR